MKSWDSNLVSALASAELRPAILLELTFSSVALKLWTGVGDLSWDSKTFLGNGWLREFRADPERADDVRGIFDIVLSGVPQDLVSQIQTSAKVMSLCTVHLAALNESGQVVGAAVLRKAGLDTAQLVEGTDIPVLILRYGNELGDAQRVKELRYNNVTQQAIFAGDKGFEHVPAAQNFSGMWGKQRRELPKGKRKKSRRKESK